MFLYYFLTTAVFIILFGPAIAAAIGTFMTFLIFSAALIFTAPAVHIFVMKHIKERDAISDKLDHAKERLDFGLTEMYERHLKEAEDLVNTKLNVLFILFIITTIILSVALYVS